MTILIDAWLERRDPALRVLNGDTREVLIEWRGMALRGLFESGLLEIDDLATSIWSLLRQSASETTPAQDR